MGVEVHIKIEENVLTGKLEFEFIPYQVGHMSEQEDLQCRHLLYFFRTYTGALQARADRINNKVAGIDPAVMQEILTKVVRDKELDETQGKQEVDITKDVVEMGGELETDMRAPAADNAEEHG